MSYLQRTTLTADDFFFLFLQMAVFILHILMLRIITMALLMKNIMFMGFRLFMKDISAKVILLNTTILIMFRMERILYYLEQTVFL